MDNRVTKRRLSEFLAYEWIMIIIAIVGAILVWELVYTMTSVRLTVGQQFKYYYDQNISTVVDKSLYDSLWNENRKVFSYDVIELNTESLTSDYNVLSVRLSIQEGDIIITDKKAPKEGATDKSVRSKTIVDGFSVYALTDLLSDAKTYLRDNFFKDEYSEKAFEELDFSNSGLIDDSKVFSVFVERMAGDNRFRSEEQKLEGFELEKERIYSLLKEVNDFDTFIKYAKSSKPELLYNYKKYEQAYQTALEQNKTSDIELYEKWLSEQEEKAYGINVEFLSGGKSNPSAYFKMKSDDDKQVTDAKDVVIMAFDFLKEQPHLQFETIAFFNTVIRECSDILG